MLIILAWIVLVCFIAVVVCLCWGILWFAYVQLPRWVRSKGVPWEPLPSEKIAEPVLLFIPRSIRYVYRRIRK